ncbi:MAG: DUF6020 family protein [Clostridia bacterium]|nr:DUF6020 family protein [Clostridia bacterium]
MDLKKFFGYFRPLSLSWLAAMAVGGYFMRVEGNIKNTLFTLLAFALFSLLSFKRPAKKEEVRRPSVVGAGIMAAALIIGTAIYKTDSLEMLIGQPASLVWTALLAAGAFWALFLITERLLCWFAAPEPSSSRPAESIWFTSNKRSLFLCWAVVFLAWVPCLLGLFPGTFSYDAPQAFWVIHGNEISDFHSVPHVYFLKMCLRLCGGNYQNMTALHSILQMLIMSFCCAFAVFYLSRMRAARWVRIAAVCWFALSPFCAVFSMVMAKDVMLGGALLLVTVMTLDMARAPGKFFKKRWKLLTLAAVCTVFALMRNNAIPALFIASALLLIIFKRHWRGVLATFGAACLVVTAVTWPLYKALDLKYPGRQESLALPAQQIAYTCKYHWKEIPINQRVEVERLFGENPGNSYNPRNGDDPKMLLKNRDLDGFWRTWAQIGQRFPREYAEAFLTLNIQLWYPDAEYPDRYSRRMYIEDNISGWENRGQVVERRTVVKPFFDFYHAFSANEAIWQKVPVVSALCSVGTYIWVIFIAFLLCWARKKIKLAAAMLPAAALWLTYLAGPLTNVRYVFPLILCLPIFVAVAAEGLRGRKGGCTKPPLEKEVPPGGGRRI